MNTSEPRLLRVEVVADLPVLWAILQRLDLPATLDRHFPAPPHWKGPLTPGEVLAVWLLFLLSQGDHCLNHVQPWVEGHQGVLSALLGKPVRPIPGQQDDHLLVPDQFAVPLFERLDPWARLVELALEIVEQASHLRCVARRGPAHERSLGTVGW